MKGWKKKTCRTLAKRILGALAKGSLSAGLDCVPKRAARPCQKGVLPDPCLKGQVVFRSLAKRASIKNSLSKGLLDDILPGWSKNVKSWVGKSGKVVLLTLSVFFGWVPFCQRLRCSNKLKVG